MSIYVKIRKSLRGFELNVEFEAGDEAVALLGASGCGKSMTLKCIAGVIKPDEGLIVVEGKTLFDSERRINLPPQKRGVGLLFQECGLFPNMTVEQNIKAVLKRSSGGRAASNLDSRFRGIAGKFYIEGLENHYPAQLSGGQRQRVALARMMAGEPSMIMLDEPLSALDNYLRWRLEGELLEILEGFPGTSLYVSHNRDEIYRLCKKVCVIDNGRSERLRAISELFETPDTLASCLLSGCKNYSRAELMEEGRIYASDWGVELECGSGAPGNICHIGVRSYSIALSDGIGANSFDCAVTRVTDDLFGATATLRPCRASTDHDFSTMRMELQKKDACGIKSGDIVRVMIAPENIMLLRG